MADFQSQKGSACSITIAAACTKMLWRGDEKGNFGAGVPAPGARRECAAES